MSASLPISEIREEFRQQLHGAGRLVITAPTGSGKSTQVPQWLLEELPAEQRILVLQPRRLAARMLAERVAWELGSALGTTVGYVTRFERAYTANTRVLFVTEGILTRMLLHPQELSQVGAIVFDEFHERSLNADLGLAMANALRKQSSPELKLIVMSATLDAERVAAFLDDSPILAASGRLYPVSISYTPRTSQSDVYRNAALALREVIAESPGDVLIFMPGAAEIRRCHDAINGLRYPEQLKVLPLYGEMPPEAQRAVMAPAECRKVILATNIAETSLTIPGVRIVIDSGLVKMGSYEPLRGVNTLETQPISVDSAEQRAGRAGREAPGICRRLWSPLEQDHKTPHTLPEIQRLDLADAILAIHCYGYSRYQDFPWFEEPPPKSAGAADELLAVLGLIDQAGGVTERGRGVRAFPAHPRLALLLWLSAQEGCYNLACGAAAILSERPLMLPGNAGSLTEHRGAQRRKQRSGGAPQSDFVIQLALVQEAASNHFQTDFCQRLGIHAGAARDIHRDTKYFQSLRPKSAAPESSDPETALARVLLRCFPDRLARRCDAGTLNCELQNRRRAILAQQSMVRDEALFVAGESREAAASGRPGSELILSLASGIREEWLWEFFENDLSEEDAVFWDNAKQQVMRRRTLACRGLILEESVRNAPPSEEAAALLAEQLQSHSMALLGWDDSCESWINRIRFLRNHFPQLELPEYNEDECAEIRNAMCQGEYRYSAVRTKPALPYLEALLTPEQQAKVRRLAPESLPLPRNRKLRITYVPGQPPKGRARIQELYDVSGPLTIADGKIPVLLDILAPNFRTVQITDDLPRFWEVHYPAIRSQLSRRYPKHEWR